MSSHKVGDFQRFPYGMDYGKWVLSSCALKFPFGFALKGEVPLGKHGCKGVLRKLQGSPSG